MTKPRRYTRAFAEARAKQGSSKETVATSIYITLPQLEKIDRLMSKRQKEESAKLGREIPRMSFADFIRLMVDELPE
jgi:ribosome-binding protein aMBF1 (putative translation factor)